MHTETTLSLFEAATKSLGAALRKFQSTTCSFFVTKELPQEEAARGRRTAALAAKVKGKGKGEGKGKGKAGSRRVFLNLATYKLHALGDYVSSIRQFGTTDNFSTLVVSGPTLASMHFTCSVSGRTRASCS
jgi:hypothetical protein